ncbi:hypothetical protein BCV70DRAFT_198188 [Testicularia cyperi]|uniref:HAD-like protein n=1 Tax=Testicularia cyperi TaxID=1882483 RepID=A0A317XUG1_9BASI|nr:hypothetical protein BCV70DRAFT_198188 [Testicularia cyperi]
MSLDNLKYKDAKYVFLTDFDGTITLLDSNDHMVDTVGMGYTERRKINVEIVEERVSYREGFKQMIESVHRPFSEMEELVRRDVTLDPGFKEFYAFAKANNIPVIIVSSGMTPIIRSILSNLIGEKDANEIEVISNDVKFTDPEQKGLTWELVYRHPDNHFGHDKSLSIAPYRQLENRPKLFFAGDGISDMSAARHADVLFVKDKEDNDLATYCNTNNIPYHLFRDWTIPKRMLEALISEELTWDDVAGKSSTNGDFVKN